MAIDLTKTLRKALGELQVEREKISLQITPSRKYWPPEAAVPSAQSAG